MSKRFLLVVLSVTFMLPGSCRAATKNHYKSNDNTSEFTCLNVYEKSLAQKYIGLLQRCGSGDNVSLSDWKEIVAQDCIKILNGAVVCMMVGGLFRRITAEKEMRTGWEIFIKNIFASDDAKMFFVYWGVIYESGVRCLGMTILTGNHDGSLIQKIDEAVVDVVAGMQGFLGKAFCSEHENKFFVNGCLTGEVLAKIVKCDEDRYEEGKRSNTMRYTQERLIEIFNKEKKLLGIYYKEFDSEIKTTRFRMFLCKSDDGVEYTGCAYALNSYPESLA